MIELFKISFLPVTLLDIIDIILVTIIFYKVYTIIRGTIAAQIFYGLIFVLILSFIAQTVQFIALGWLLKLLSDIWVLAFIILFQPEIRRMLVIIGRTPLMRIFFKNDPSNVSDIISEAAYELAQIQHGALIIIVKSGGIRGVVETGEIIDASISKNLLKSIFFPRSPLHDGAVIIRNDIIEAARCTLPLSSDTKKDGRVLGMRHRAGLGISEIADVISVIVSEETGSISVAENGILKTGLSKESLRKYLNESLKKSNEKNFRSFLKGSKRN
ncbi:diadenylate cyclase CdaA [Stygiobacter electus]|uniref:Diadenylate cyclase n=1 Tax=Stygiobacter electus TaxID=3032292 RepID=A0AAE3NUZ6_9BACT|nr:diadenylate cyclase CdaA [Stygiobacter electus]MDF1611411.1 diadenylate cyclase CdaA [Stygiobacter electus]